MASFYGEDASKQALRSAYLEVPTLSPTHRARIDGDLLAHVRAYRRFRDASLVIVFPSQREECDTTVVAREARAAGKQVLMAKAALDGSYTLWDDETREEVVPTEDELAASICFVPGLVFDAEGYRVAYGAGYVDNYLATYGGCSIAAVRSLQVSSNPLPHDEHDVPVDVLISDAAVWHCRR